MNDRRHFLSVLALGATATAASRITIAGDATPGAAVRKTTGRLIRHQDHSTTLPVARPTTPPDSLPPDSPWHLTRAICWGDLHSHSNVSADWNMTLGRQYAKYEPADYFADAK